MTVIAKDDGPTSPWRPVFEQVRAQAAARGVPLLAVVVLVPYAQLMAEARRQWQRLHPQGFVPRFETTRNWAAQWPGPQAHAWAYRGDRARDALTVPLVLERAGLAAQGSLLAGPVLEMAAQLADAAGAVPPHQRAAWGETARSLLPLAAEGSALDLEARAARVALEWVLASPRPADALFAPAVRASVRLLVAVQGLQPDPLEQALLAHWGEEACALALPPAQAVAPPATRIALHASEDAEAEAWRTAACVLAHLAARRTPVALVDNDRALTRRVLSLLQGSGVAVRDETGWSLSTTRAAARLMAVLRACAWDASADTVLDALKQLEPAGQEALPALERWLRRQGAALWAPAARELEARAPSLPAEAALAARWEGWRAPLAGRRTLPQWLEALRTLLRGCGLWQSLLADPAGQCLLAELRLAPDGLDAELHEMEGAGRRFELAEFMHWISEVLEGARYRPAYPEGAPVVVLPLAQLLGREFAAVVVPGCDEKRLPAAPEPTGPWSGAQREGLGLPTREAMAEAQRAAWEQALALPAVDLVWRMADEGGEPLLASPLLQQLTLRGLAVPGQDACLQREVLPAPVARPQVVGSALPVRSLSASAYEDLRKCPYRFFALRQLGLRAQDELDAEADKRSFGSWLHRALQHFHEALQREPHGPRAALLDAAAERAMRELRLGEGDFLPFASGWPAVRDAYLQWLAKHEDGGGSFGQAELRLRRPLAGVELVGSIDRVDATGDAGGRAQLLIDYKTEDAQVTRRRIGAGCEDTQLAFYAALVEAEGPLEAAYLNVSERGEVVLQPQPDVLALREQLLRGIAHDLQRIAQGVALQALGEGRSCAHCDARGLCRKDFWQ
ncbi:ATP-dependent helicase/nuclease subunit B [Melaminivora alkalimesophila]|uniref:ATP-dependent helicase/nuclease subunit B n=2 Tax=Melaminivora alkalimesophila TaxID=1165852 RepID=A0A317RGY7_9BURK|nr:PD-(D/E)XK nuclease family protein [Melaminivora alkalimesophila]PWW49037.1 ATP-dependent helicase/nuclease subunit B [Melaminivora alkalimesophila]